MLPCLYKKVGKEKAFMALSAYVQCNAQVYKTWALKCKKAIERYHARKEQKLVNSKDKKSLFKYLSSKLCSRAIIPDLKNKSGQILISDLEKADAFNAHFVNTFTRDIDKMPSFNNRSGKNFIHTISIPIYKVKKTLHFVNKSGAAGPDNIPGIFTKICVIVCLFI